MKQSGIISKSDRAQHLAIVREMENRLPTLAYMGPVGSTTEERGASIARWRRDAEAAGYPLCEECGEPISRSNWRHSITMCPLCEQKEMGNRL